MSEILSLITDGIVRYLLAASVAGAVLTLLVWLIIKLARIEAPVHRHMLWLCALVCVVTLPAIGLYGPRLNLEVLAPEGQEVAATSPQARHEHDVPPAREVTVVADPPQPVQADGDYWEHMTTPIQARIIPQAIQVVVPDGETS